MSVSSARAYPAITLDRTPDYERSGAEVMSRLRVRVDTGLSTRAVLNRREHGGLNIIPATPRRRPLAFLIDRLTDVLVMLLIGAGVISLLIGEYADAVMIVAALFLDLIMSYVQVRRAERTIALLHSHVRRLATVLRDEKYIRVPASELVVGDIIEFRAGERIPADARILTAAGLRINEATLTGESDDATKQTATLTSRTPLAGRRNMVYLGTTVTNGLGRAVVTAIGTATEIGKVAQILKGEVSPASPLRRKLQQTGTTLAVMVTVLVIGLAALQVVAGASVLTSAYTALTLIVSALPEDLTVILTIALTVGVVRILRRRGVVRELTAGESLGSATVICTDKTGTLTQGTMKANLFDTLQGHRLESAQSPTTLHLKLALTSLAIATDAHPAAGQHSEYVGSATERAALAFAEASGLAQQQLRQTWRFRDALSFGAAHKYRAALHDHPTNGSRTLFVNGAPEILLAASTQALDAHDTAVTLTPARQRRLEQQLATRAAGGERLLGVAVRRNLHTDSITHRDVKDLLFLGVLSLTDPIRPEVRAAIADTRRAGINVKVVTGDFAATARAVARDVGLTVTDDAVITSSELENISDAELSRRIDSLTVFARVTPLDKQRIIRALQARGHVVAMTGDGVNDAVALKSADIGVAMGSGKDIAHDAADLILLDDNFATIVAAIREGRVIRDNIRKVISFLLSTNVAEVALFLVSLLLKLPLPLLPAQILWINLVTDGTSDIALSLEPEEDTVMSRRPEPAAGSLITRKGFWHIAYAGAVMTTVAAALYWWCLEYLKTDVAVARTLVFTFIAVSSILSTWSFRSLSASIISRGLFKNPWLFASAGFSLTLQVLAVYAPPLQKLFRTVPLELGDWLVIILLSFITVIIIDARKLLVRSSLRVQSLPLVTPKLTPALKN